MKMGRFTGCFIGIVFCIPWIECGQAPQPIDNLATDPDFLDFYNHPYTAFENDLPDLYHKLTLK